MRTPSSDYRLELAVSQMDAALASLEIAIRTLYEVFEASGDVVRRDAFDIDSNDVLLAIEQKLNPFFETIGYKLGHEWVDAHLETSRGLAQEGRRPGGVL